MDAVFHEYPLDVQVHIAAQQELLAWLASELGTHDHSCLFNPGDTLALQWFDEHVAVVGMLHQLLSQLLDQLTDFFDIGFERHQKVLLVDHPVAAVVGDVSQLAEGNSLDHTAVMT